ncbi:uncharacterized protein LOC132760136 [Ruditapes philippinarum]|uniref:uncharacterized protein LOC132760136 n=1 Tax=Ruditapes philippinarum TaxID=129788 RepID=UPI00295A65CB|nr:uncharacterized protein LOC132760136 [Ruditapes philippinarum]
MFVFFLFFIFSFVGIHGIKEETFMQNIMNEITELKTRQTSCERYKAKVAELEAAVVQLKTKQSSYEAKVDDLQKRNGKLELKMLQIQHDMDSKRQIHNIQHKDKPDNLTTYQNSYKRMAVSGQVAFTAGVSNADLTQLGDHHTIIFDKPITNIGNAYSVHSGIFQAPLKGVYVFTMTLMVVPRHSEYLDIVVDGNLINQIFADASSVDDFISTTKQWVLDLNVGSEVWIRTSTYENKGEIHGKMHTTFSGFLLFETE